MKNDTNKEMKTNSFWWIESKTFIIFIFVATLILSDIVLNTPIKKYTLILQASGTLIGVILIMTSVIIHWITYDVNDTYNKNIFSFGFLVAAFFNLINTFSYAPLRLHSKWNVEISVKFWIFARLAEVMIIVMGSTNFIKEIRSRGKALLVTSLVIIVASVIIIKIPRVFTYENKVTIGYTIFNIGIFVLYLIAILCLNNRKREVTSNKRMNLLPGVTFALASSVCYMLSNQTADLLSVWGNILRLLFYCYIFRNFLSISIVYPYNNVKRLYDEGEERYRSSFDNLTIGVALTDLEGRIIKTNKPLQDILGYGEQELIGVMFENIIPDGDTHINKNSIESLLGTSLGKILMFEVRYIHKNGKDVWVRVNISRANNINNEPHYFVYELQDISSTRKVIELELGIQQDKKQLMETLELDKIKTEFIANLSHELRTPLNVITGATQLLEMNLQDNMNEKIHRNLTYIRQNSRRLLRLVNNLIDTTKLEAGFQQLNLSNLEIVGLVEDITLSIADYTSMNGIELIFDTNVEEKVVACDPDKLERIVLNLLSNAIKFTDEGGLITVNVEDDINTIIISVKDTGIGIPKDKQEIIFDRFRQVDKSLTKTREGSGIGLSLVKALVEQHGGTIRVVSEALKGSEFIVTLPVYLVDSNKKEEASNAFYMDRVERIKVEFSDIYLKEKE